MRWLVGGAEPFPSDATANLTRSLGDLPRTWMGDRLVGCHRAKRAAASPCERKKDRQQYWPVYPDETSRLITACFWSRCLQSLGL